MANSHCLGGTSGSVLASRLAASRRAPKVLLLEAGGRNDPGRLRSPELRFSAAYTEPELVCQHSTVAQPQLNGRKFWNGRGFGLGGTTAINFGFWTLASEVDYNEWARLVDDDCWKWEGINGVKARLRKIENLHGISVKSKQGILARIWQMNIAGTARLICPTRRSLILKLWFLLLLEKHK